MKKATNFLLDNRWLVAGLLLTLIVGGIYVMLHLPLEAFPDLTNNQVVVTVQCPGMSPVEVEHLVTYPIETSLDGHAQTSDGAVHIQARPLHGHRHLR